MSISDVFFSNSRNANPTKNSFVCHADFVGAIQFFLISNEAQCSRIGLSNLGASLEPLLGLSLGPLEGPSLALVGPFPTERSKACLEESDEARCRKLHIPHTKIPT